MLSDVVGERIASLRKARGVTRDELSRRCREMGWPLTVAVLTNVETGRRKGAERRREISIDEIAVIGRALGVPPVLLCYPLGVDGLTEVAPGVESDPWTGARWFMGEAHLDGTRIDDDPGAAPLVLFRRHQLLVEGIIYGQLLADMIDYSGPEVPPSAITPGFDYRGWLPEHRVTNEDALSRLVELRREIRRSGLIPPELPGILADLEAQRG